MLQEVIMNAIIELQRQEAVLDMQKSIFPVFDIGVPMPADTAVPGSYEGGAPAPAFDRPEKT